MTIPSATMQQPVLRSAGNEMQQLSYRAGLKIIFDRHMYDGEASFQRDRSPDVVVFSIDSLTYCCILIDHFLSSCNESLDADTRAVPFSVSCPHPPLGGIQ